MPKGRRLAIRGISTETTTSPIRGLELSLSESSKSSPFVFLLQPYCNENELIVSCSDDGIGTSSGGTYLSINTDIATIVNARSVPTLTCKHKYLMSIKHDELLILHFLFDVMTSFRIHKIQKAVSRKRRIIPYVPLQCFTNIVM